jgi:hypothetical protein
MTTLSKSHPRQYKAPSFSAKQSRDEREIPKRLFLADIVEKLEFCR